MKNLLIIITLSLYFQSNVYCQYNGTLPSDKSSNYSESQTLAKESDYNKEEATNNSRKIQLHGYLGFTKWLIDNQSEFKNVIKETSKESSTKWIIDSNYQLYEKEDYNVDTKVNTSICNNTNYIVKKGDTLYSLSSLYDITLDQLLKWNNLSKDSILQIGQSLFISEPVCNNIKDNKQASKEITVEKDADSVSYIKPKITKSDSKETIKLTKPSYLFYKIKPKDTIYSIAKKHNMTAQELIDLNNLVYKNPLVIDSIIKVRSNYSNQDIKKYEIQNSRFLKDGFIWPVIGRLLIPYGPQKEGIVNEGINIAAKQGTKVKASQNGIVIYVGNALEKFGTIVLVQHEENWVSAYAHVSDVVVEKGSIVKKGQVIASVGVYGLTNQAQLHFELRKNLEPVDPLFYLNSYR